MSQQLIDTGHRGPSDRVDDREHGNGNTAVQSHGYGNGSAAASDDTSAKDPTLSAIEALSSALEQMASDQRLLEQRLRSLHRERSAGRPWRDILADEEPPGTMQVVSRMLACLAKASGTLRKELVDTLRREGVSIPAIARLFGVTHQRVSNLLRRPAE